MFKIDGLFEHFLINKVRENVEIQYLSIYLIPHYVSEFFISAATCKFAKIYAIGTKPGK